MLTQGSEDADDDEDGDEEEDDGEGDDMAGLTALPRATKRRSMRDMRIVKTNISRRGM